MTKTEKKYRLKFYNTIMKTSIESYDLIDDPFAYIPYKFICIKFIYADFKHKSHIKDFNSIRNIARRYGITKRVSEGIIKTRHNLVTQPM